MKRTTKTLVMTALVSVGLVATGCSSPPRSNVAAPSSRGGGYGGAAPATAPLLPSASPAPLADDDRAGLGTEWGENRDSSVHSVAFDRASPDVPFALATVRYNDRDGFRALAGGRGGQERAAGVTLGGGAVSVVVQDASGDSLEAVRKNGQLFVVGRAGERYSLRLRNNTRRRFEAVATVDGLDVMDGTRGSFEHRGYVLPPSGEVVIDGFRKNENEVAAFRFASVADSYAAQTGEARDVGVIGVAFFREIGDDSENDDALRRTANPFPDQNRFAHPPPGRD